MARSEYKHWVDLNGDGFDARERCLMESSLTQPNIHQAKVISGVWCCKATAMILKSPRHTDCDHIIAIDEVDKNIGRTWTPDQKIEFANDPVNLLITSKSWNRSKGSGDPFSRMPPNIAFWNEYLNQREIVKEKYNIPIDKAEQDAIAFFRLKAEHHEKGVNVDRVRIYMGKNFNWVYSPL